MEADRESPALWWPLRSWGRVTVTSAREGVGSERTGGLGPSQRRPHFWAGLSITVPRGGCESHSKSGRSETGQGRRGSSCGARGQEEPGDRVLAEAGQVGRRSHQVPSLSLLSARLWPRPWILCLRSSWEGPLSARASGRHPRTPPALGYAAQSLWPAAVSAKTRASPVDLGCRPHPWRPIPRAWTCPSSHTEVTVVRLGPLPRPFASPWPCPVSAGHLLVTAERRTWLPKHVPSPGLGPPGRQLKEEAGEKPLPSFAVRTCQWLLGDRCPCSERAPRPVSALAGLARY